MEHVSVFEITLCILIGTEQVFRVEIMTTVKDTSTSPSKINDTTQSDITNTTSTIPQHNTDTSGSVEKLQHVQYVTQSPSTIPAVHVIPQVCCVNF